MTTDDQPPKPPQPTSSLRNSTDFGLIMDEIECAAAEAAAAHGRDDYFVGEVVLIASSRLTDPETWAAAHEIGLRPYVGVKAAEYARARRRLSAC